MSCVCVRVCVCVCMQQCCIGVYCAIVANPSYLTQWQGENASYAMHLEVPCGTDGSGSLVNRSGYLFGGTVSKYVEMGDVGARGFVFDAVVGIMAWLASRKQRQSLLPTGAPLSLFPPYTNWRNSRPQTNAAGAGVVPGVAAVAAQCDWLGVGCMSFFFTAWLDVIYGFEIEWFGGPWLYFGSMICWTISGFCYIADSMGATGMAFVT
jgi:hypothetical protein